MSRGHVRDSLPPGALVISLDFELHWGLRHNTPPDAPYRRNVLGARHAVPAMLDLFEEFGVAATWATVGFLFARSRAEIDWYSPAVRPSYDDPARSPYAEPIGDDENNDPLHLAPSLIRGIMSRPRQEIATHTFSHYFCWEPGQKRDEFAADLHSAIAISESRGVRPRSIVFPGNQHNPEYDQVLLDAGILCYRGNPWLYQRPSARFPRRLLETGRLVDAYSALPPRDTIAWASIPQPSGLCDVRTSLFLRPHSDTSSSLAPLRLRRITRSLETAAKDGRVFHLWWHPHNFGTHLQENLAFLRAVLSAFVALRDRFGMQSLSMVEAAEMALAAGSEPLALSI